MILYLVQYHMTPHHKKASVLLKTNEINWTIQSSSPLRQICYPFFLSLYNPLGFDVTPTFTQTDRTPFPSHLLLLCLTPPDLTDSDIDVRVDLGRAKKKKAVDAQFFSCSECMHQPQLKIGTNNVFWLSLRKGLMMLLTPALPETSTISSYNVVDQLEHSVREVEDTDIIRMCFANLKSTISDQRKGLDCVFNSCTAKTPVSAASTPTGPILWGEV